MAPSTPRRGPDLPPFQHLLERHHAEVRRFLLAAVGPDDADDCLQETFLAALRAYPRLRHADNLRGWLLAIATRKAVDAGRSRARRPVPVARVEAVGREDERPADGMEPWLVEALRALPPRQRAAVAGRLLLDRSYAELAADLRCSVEAARANVYQGLSKLRDAWRSHGGN